MIKGVHITQDHSGGSLGYQTAVPAAAVPLPRPAHSPPTPTSAPGWRPWSESTHAPQLEGTASEAGQGDRKNDYRFSQGEFCTVFYM